MDTVVCEKLLEVSKKLDLSRSQVVENLISQKHPELFNSDKNISQENNSVENKDKMDFSDDYSEKVNKMIALNKHEFRVIGFMPKVDEWCKKMEKRSYGNAERHEVLLRLVFEAIAYSRSKNKSIADLAEHYPKYVLIRLIEVEKNLGLKEYTTLEYLNQRYDLIMEQAENG